MRVSGVSLGHLRVSEADHWILSLVPEPSYAFTHVVRTPFPHVAISVVSAASFVTEPRLREAADAAAADRFGRAVVFPGSSGLTGRLTVADLLGRTAIDRVEVLGSGVASDEQVVDTLEFVRPQRRGDELVLVTMPAAGGVLVPFETREPTPCCADHG